ncbi:MAG: hypothetical protein M3Y31_07560 [Gemmatimonadota bacterium]|nr:hypothetical protein [Gemmatimonadota bacterium]
MLKRLAAAAATASLLLIATGCAATPVGHGELRVIGTWTGAVGPEGDGVLAMVVTDAAHATFTGSATFSASGLPSTARMRAELTPHGHLVAHIGDDARVEAHITDERTLDYFFVRYGTDPVYACGRLTREE